MTIQLHKSRPVILSCVALLLALLSCLSPLIPDMEPLFWPLMLWGVFTVPVTFFAILIIFALVAIEFTIPESPYRTFSIIAVVVALLLLTSATAACSYLTNALGGSVIRSTARLNNHVYHLTHYDRGDSYYYSAKSRPNVRIWAEGMPMTEEKPTVDPSSRSELLVFERNLGFRS